MPLLHVISYRHFVGGPRDGTYEQCYSAVPTKLIRVFEEAGSGMQCDDEQVTKLLGYYVRAENSHIGWYYDWEPA